MSQSEKSMNGKIEVQLPEFLIPSNSDAVLDLCPLGKEFLGWERASFIYLHHSLLGTSAVSDSFVALQFMTRDLLTGHFEAADGWDRKC